MSNLFTQSRLAPTFVVMLSAVVADARAQARYELQIIRGMASPFGYSSATGISDSGIVVGGTTPRSAGPWSAVAGRPAIWVQGTMAILPRINPSDGLNNFATAVNDRGHAVGAVSFTFKDRRRAFDTTAALWVDGDLVPIGRLPGDGHSMAWDINEHGEVVGFSGPGFWDPGHDTAFHYAGGVLTRLSHLAGAVDSAAYAINGAGVVVGTSGEFARYANPNPAVFTSAVMWDGGAVRELAPPPGVLHAQARAINDRGVVVGSAGTYSPATREFGFAPAIWRGGAGIPLPLLPGDDIGQAWGIAEDGTVVGSSGAGGPTGRLPVPVVWIEGSVYELAAVTDSPPGWAFVEALGINGRGEIVGSGTLDGASMAFVARPVR